MKKTVNFCGNCPFMYDEYHEYKNDTITTICTLAYNNKQDDYIISEFLKRTFSENDEFQIIEIKGNDSLKTLKVIKPQILFLDVDLKENNGVESFEASSIL